MLTLTAGSHTYSVEYTLPENIPSTIDCGDSCRGRVKVNILLFEYSVLKNNPSAIDGGDSYRGPVKVNKLYTVHLPSKRSIRFVAIFECTFNPL